MIVVVAVTAIEFEVEFEVGDKSYGTGPDCALHAIVEVAGPDPDLIARPSESLEVLETRCGFGAQNLSREIEPHPRVLVRSSFRLN